MVMRSSDRLRFVLAFCLGWTTVLLLSLTAWGQPSEMALTLAQRPRTVSATPVDVSNLSAAEAAVVQAYMGDVKRSGQKGIFVTNVAAENGFALLSWQDEHGGGLCILKQVNGRWTIVRGSGGTFGVEFLKRYGVPEATAINLVRRVVPGMLNPQQRQ